MKFSTKWYTKLCILVDPFLRNCVTKSKFRYLKKKAQKKALALKGLKNKSSRRNVLWAIKKTKHYRCITKLKLSYFIWWKKLFENPMRNKWDIKNISNFPGEPKMVQEHI